jgi:hypothetical protein
MAKATTKNKKSDVIDGEVVDEKALAVVPQEDEKTPEPKKTEIVKRDSAFSIVGNVTTKQLKQALEVQTEQRKLIEDFIKAHLREGTDYGKIHVVKNCMQEEKQRGSCDRDYHYSKSILFKPGQEKIFSLFSITDELIKDPDAYEMLPGVSGLVAFKCIMFQKGKRIGEGRGAATLSSERSDPNSTLKKAEKRARMDACLSLGFSEYFTQDLDDPDYAAQREMANSKAAAEAERRDKDEFGLLPRDPDAPIDNNERGVLHRILIKAGFTDTEEILELLRSNGIVDPSAMTSGQARDMMGKIAHGLFNQPPEKPIEPEEPEAPPVPEEPELEVDDDFRDEIQRRVDQCGLNARGVMWLLQRSIGKPFAKWDTLTDDQYRKLYDVLIGIEDGRIAIDDSHVKGFIENMDTPEPDATVESESTDTEPEQGSLISEEEAPKNAKPNQNSTPAH